MKKNKKYEDSARATFLGFCGIVIIILFLVITTHIPGCKKFSEEVSEGIKNDPRPANPISNYLPPSHYQQIDTIVDSTLYHSDEDVMWIGGNGDTIWE